MILMSVLSGVGRSRTRSTFEVRRPIFLPWSDDLRLEKDVVQTVNTDENFSDVRRTTDPSLTFEDDCTTFMRDSCSRTNVVNDVCTILGDFYTVFTDLSSTTETKRS